MAFGNIGVFYFPTSGNAGAGQAWGTDVRKLLDAADAGNTATTQTDHGTGGATTRDLDPYTNNNANGTTDNFGWAVTPADMGSTALKKRAIRAGNHTITLRTASNAAEAGDGSTFTLYVYRVGPSPGRARSLLGSATGAAFSYGAVPGTYQTQTVSVNLSEIVFEDDETVQYSVENTSPGVAVVGRTNTHDTGTQGGVAIRVDIPGLITLAEITGTSNGAATATAAAANIMATNGASSGVATAAAEVGGVAGANGTSAGTSTATAEVGGFAGAVGASDGSATATADVAVVKGMDGTATVGAGGTIVKPVYIFDD